MTIWELVCEEMGKDGNVRDEYLCIWLDVAYGDISVNRAKILCEREFDVTHNIYK